MATDMVDRHDSNSPCIGVCLLDEKDLCIGCRRSIPEISNWAVYTEDQRQATLKELNNR